MTRKRSIRIESKTKSKKLKIQHNDSEDESEYFDIGMCNFTTARNGKNNGKVKGKNKVVNKKKKQYSRIRIESSSSDEDINIPLSHSPVAGPSIAPQYENNINKNFDERSDAKVILEIRGISSHLKRNTIAGYVFKKSEKMIIKQNFQQIIYFSFDIMDKNRSFIQVHVRGSICDNLFNVVQTNSAYEICGFIIKKRISSSYYETAYDLELLEDTKITIGNSSDYDLSLIPKTFISINEISLNHKDRLIDFCAYISAVQEKCEQQHFKDESINYKREIVMKDEKGNSITVTFWGQSAVNFHYKINQILTIRGAKVNWFYAPVISIVCDTTITLNEQNEVSEALQRHLRGY